MNRKAIKVISVFIVCLIIVTQSASPVLAWDWHDHFDWDDEFPHGTADETITESMINNTPPADYVINSNYQADAKDGKYLDYFLEDSLQSVYIEIDENNLNYLLQNAIDEPYVMTKSVTIGDVSLGYCGLRTKGAYTLAHSVTDNPGSDRFSFTVNFGKYIKKKDYGEKQTFFGCEKISFNNFFFDKSMMKEFFALKLMDEMGLPTPYYGLAKLYINDEYYGVYAMIEAMDTPILERYYNVDSSELSDYLCKPEGTKLDYYDILEDSSPLWENDEETYAEVEQMLPTVTEWVRRINCLKDKTDFNGSEIDVNSDEYIELLGQVLNIDEVVRYFAVHSWLCQMDNMFTQKNYGLYISEDGISTIVPWDYDLSFGCFYPSTAERTANYPIDVMYSLDYQFWNEEPTFSERFYSSYPLFYIIYQNDALMEQYHSYMKDCSRIAALGGTAKATGTAYDPGYFNSYIDKMQDEIINAASEKLADNVYYMNWTEQPNDVVKALPNLAKIIALRAAGVYTQVESIETKVCATGCNLETLGNGARGSVSNEGTLTNVDSVTGIFITADYEGGNRKAAPGLTVNQLTEESSRYDYIADSVITLPGDSVLIYEIRSGVTPVSDYTLTIPLAQKQTKFGSAHLFYMVTDDKVEYISMKSDDNLYTGTTSSLGHLIVITRPLISNIIVCAAGAAVIAAAVIVPLSVSRKKKNKASANNKTENIEDQIED